MIISKRRPSFHLPKLRFKRRLGEHKVNLVRTAVCFMVSFMLGPPLGAAPIPVRFAEGLTHGFLSLRSLEGETLGYGELLQVPRKEGIESRLVLRFRDGSLHDEKAIFTQNKFFTLQRYTLVQNGPSFPTALEVSLQRDTGQYSIKYREGKDGREERRTEKLELPPDLYNGMLAMLLKNLRPNEKETVHVVAFTPKPWLVKMLIVPDGNEAVQVGDSERSAIRFVVEPDLGWLKLFASLLGKEVPNYYFWILGGEAPAFLKFQGPLHPGGPVLRIELSSPRWPGLRGQKSQ